MEDNSKEEIKPNLEEQLEKSNSEATRLIQELESKKVEYSELLEDLNTQKEDISSILSEINTAKQTFIDDINKKLDEYSEKFTEVNSEIDTLKSDTEETFKTLDSEYNELIDKYKTDADEKMEEMVSKVDEMTTKLNDENDEFSKFIADNKAAYEQQYEKIRTLVSEYQSSTTESLTSIKARLDEATTNAEKIKQIEAQAMVFKETLDEYIKNMTTTTEEITTKTKQYNDDTQSIINTNQELTEEIKEQLQKATGVSLFHMFQKRKEALEKNQGWWLTGVIASIIALVAFSWWIISSLQSIPQNGSIDWFKDAIFKFTLSTPVIYLLYFLTDRYTKLRRLIEEYAFKSAISLALTPYYDLVQGLDDDTQEKDKDFLIAVIGNIFKTPTDKVFKTKEAQFDLDFSNYYKNIANVFAPNANRDEDNK